MKFNFNKLTLACKKQPLKVFFEKLNGFLVFLVILGILNILGRSIENQTFLDIINFLDTQIIFLMVLTMIGIVSGIFWNLSMPFVLLAPLISGFEAVFILTFINRIINIFTIYWMTGASADLIYTLLFWIVVIVGYIIIITRVLKWRCNTDEKKETGKKANKDKEKTSPSKEKANKNKTSKNKKK
jgi:hypothetical protein